MKTQEELLQKAIQLVNKGGLIVYSTCSILKEENEEMLQKLQNKVEMEPIFFDKTNCIPILKKHLGTTVCPSPCYEGFFIAKMILK